MTKKEIEDSFQKLCKSVGGLIQSNDSLQYYFPLKDIDIYTYLDSETNIIMVVAINPVNHRTMFYRTSYSSLLDTEVNRFNINPIDNLIGYISEDAKSELLN